MKTITALLLTRRPLIAITLLINLTVSLVYAARAFGEDLTLPSGGRVTVEFVSSDADFSNTLSVFSPAVGIAVSNCELASAAGLPGVHVLSGKVSQPGCRVELDADPVTPGIQPFAAGTTLGFRLCTQKDVDRGCEFVWASNPELNSDGFDHVRTTPSADARIFELGWEDLPKDQADEDFNDLIVRVELPIGTTFGPPSSANPSGTAAEPVNTATGNYFFQRLDLALPGRGLPVIFTRTYNSLDNYFGPFGHGWTHSYNILLTEQPEGSVVIKQGDGHEEFYDPIGDGHYRPRFGGVFNILVKNPDASFTLTLKDQTQHDFSATGKLTRISDRNNNTLSFRYDAERNLTAITDTVGRTVTLDYDTHNRIIQLVDPIGRKVQYSYEGDGNLASDTNPNGGVILYSYDSVHRVTQIIDQRDNTLVKNTYDTAGRVLSQTNGRDFTTKFAYGVPLVGDTSIADPLGNTTIHTHDAQLRLINVTDPPGNKVTLTYGEDNSRTSITDKSGNVTQFTNDDRGNITSITDPMRHTIALTYDARNNLTSVTDEEGFTTTFDYDANGNLISAQDALENITTSAYNGFGQVLKTTDPRGKVTHYSYDEQGNLKAVTDALGGITAYAYDGIGRLIRLTDPKGHTATASYDANSRLIQIVDALKRVTGYAYDPAGNPIEVTDARGHKTLYDYDEVNNLVTVTDALGHITRYIYDANNNRTGLIDANGHMRTYAFDALNRLISITDPLGNTTTYAYDAASNVTALTDANGTTNTFAYDANNLLKEIAYGDGSSVTYRYDANENLVRMRDQHGTTTYTHDALDRLIEVTHPDGSVGYGYDAVGNRTSLSYPDGKEATYAYDALNRLTRVTDWEGRETRYRYDAASNVSRVIYPNDTSILYHYDAADRLVRVKNKRNEDILAQFRYTLDKIGNRTKVRQSGLLVPELTLSYTYDSLSQLIAEKERSGGRIKRTEYTYDPAGNRLSLTEGSGEADDGDGHTDITNYIYDAANRLLQAGDTTFTYDGNGNRLTEENPVDNDIDYGYDSANRLIQVVRDERAVAYVYDGDGNKVEQEISGKPGSTGTLQFLNDVATPLPVVLEQNRTEESRNETIHYLYGIALVSEELAQPEPGSRPNSFFYHSDGLGSTIALSDRVGRTRAEYQYDAWGNLERSFGDVPNPFLFTGEEQDPETGLYYLRARWYDAKVGRFLTKDPFGGIVDLPQSINEYVYVFNNPINFVDPSGRFVHKKLKRAAQSQVGRFVIKTVVAVVITKVLLATPLAPVAPFVGGAAGEFVDRLISGRPITFECIVAQDVTIGGLSGVTSPFSSPDPLTALAFSALAPSPNSGPLADRCGKAVTVPSLAVQGFRKLPRLNTEGLAPLPVDTVSSSPLTIQAK